MDEDIFGKKSEEWVWLIFLELLWVAQWDMRSVKEWYQFIEEMKDERELIHLMIHWRIMISETMRKISNFLT